MSTGENTLGTRDGLLGAVNERSKNNAETIVSLEHRLDRLISLGTRLSWGLALAVISSLFAALAPLIASGKVASTSSGIASPLCQVEAGRGGRRRRRVDALPERPFNPRAGPDDCEDEHAAAGGRWTRRAHAPQRAGGPARGAARARGRAAPR